MARREEPEEAKSDWEGQVLRPSVEFLSAMLSIVAWFLISSLWLLARLGGDALANGDVPGLAILESQLFSQSLILATIAVLRPDSASFGRSPWQTASIGYLVILPLFLGLGLLSELSFQALGVPIEAQPQLDFLVRDVGSSSWLLAVVAVVVVGPIFEEFVFRKFLLDGLREWVGNVWGLLVSATLFGLMHVGDGWHLFVPITFLGLGFGVLRMKSGGLLAPILAHCLHNAVMVGWAIYDEGEFTTGLSSRIFDPGSWL